MVERTILRQSWDGLREKITQIYSQFEVRRQLTALTDELTPPNHSSPIYLTELFKRLVNRPKLNWFLSQLIGAVGSVFDKHLAQELITNMHAEQRTRLGPPPGPTDGRIVSARSSELVQLCHHSPNERSLLLNQYWASMTRVFADQKKFILIMLSRRLTRTTFSQVQ